MSQGPGIELIQEAAMIEVRLRPEVEAQIAAEAQARGIEIGRYVEELLEERSAAGQRNEPDRQQAVNAMLTFAQEYRLTLDCLKIEDLIHEGHEY
jgi:hypothetical protein